MATAMTVGVVPALEDFTKAFHVDITTASYLTTVPVLSPLARRIFPILYSFCISFPTLRMLITSSFCFWPSLHSFGFRFLNGMADGRSGSSPSFWRPLSTSGLHMSRRIQPT